MASDLGPFEVGQIIALHREGYSHRQIADRVTRGRDQPGPKLSAVGEAVRRLDADPSWTGSRTPGSGRKRKTTCTEDAAFAKITRLHRGARKVNSSSLQALAPTLRKISKRTVRRRLRETGLRYLRRRRKTVIPAASVAARLVWAVWVKAQRPAYLRRWVFTDGCCFYLSRTVAEHACASRAALGIYVWRESAAKDALFKDCVGPSVYAKGQGTPVRIWGLLYRGRLHIRILPHRAVMNRKVYSRIIKGDFARWLRGARMPILVQDHERALWCGEPRAALRDTGIELAERHPKHSADLSPIENVWALLRARLDDTLPAATEGRDVFLSRLRAAVHWLNRNRRGAMLKLAGNMKQRAHDVQECDGHRTKW